jgi:hypothetical protein
MVNATVSGDRGPPNSCSLTERRPGSQAWSYCWDLPVAVLRDPADDQRKKYRQRHPRRDDYGGPASDVHTDVYPPPVTPQPNRTELARVTRSQKYGGCEGSGADAAAGPYRPCGASIQRNLDPKRGSVDRRHTAWP